MLSIKELARRASMEDHSDGLARVERELVYFAKFDLGQLKEIGRDPTYQEQYEIMNDRGTIRVRCIDHKEYILCSKTWTPGVKGKKEVEQDTTVAMFENFRAMAPSGLCKTRYYIAIEGTEGTWPKTDDYEPPLNGALCWEVDVFHPNLDTSESAEWCKIDLEIPERFNELNLPDVPSIFTDVFKTQPMDRTPEEKAKIDDIMKSVRVNNY
jgi:hypothetical protein